MKETSPISCAVVMPAFNEEACLANVTKDWTSELDALFGNSYRFIVVNDGSRDQTGSILDSLARCDSRIIALHKSNGGHGSAVLAGFKEAEQLHADYVFQTDSDRQFDPKDLEKLWTRRHESDFILGNRRSRKDPLIRIWVTRTMRALVRITFGVRVKDPNVPFRLIRGSFLSSLLKALPKDVFAPNIFLSILASKDGKNTLDIAVEHRERQTGVVSIRRWKLLKTCLRSTRELIAFRLTLGSKLNLLRSGIQAYGKAS